MKLPTTREREALKEADQAAKAAYHVGNFALGARWWEGFGSIRWSDADSTDFSKNALKVVSEMGFGFAVQRPSYFVEVTGF